MKIQLSKQVHSHFKLLHLAIMLSVFFATSNIHGQCNSPCSTLPNTNEFKALESFYCSTDGDNWKENAGWFDAINNGTNCDYCDWYGILCNDEGRVISIDLDGIDSHLHTHADGNQLSGNIPANIIDLEFLEKLYLSHNTLGDTLPNALFQTWNLEYVDLSHNSFVGNIPSTVLGHFYELLDLSHNAISGTIPIDEWDELGGEIINFSFNQLQGQLPLIGAFDLYINNNNFSGTLEDINNYTFVENINLSHNNFTGEIPKSITSLIYAKIDLSNNDLSGCIPQNVVTYCENNKLKIHENPKLPWQGNIFDFCETLGLEFQQYGVPCDDGDDSNGNTDIILDDCTCGPMPVGINDQNIQLSLYPNPTSGIIQIGNKDERALDYQLIDIHGSANNWELIKEGLIDLSALTSGVYFLKVKFESGEILTDRVIKF